MIKGLFPKIYGLLKSPPSGIDLGGFSAILPPMNKIMIDEDSVDGALGHVTTEDTDGNGILDTIHISSPRMAEELARLNVTQTALGNIDSLSPEELRPLLSAFVEVISHEMGHINDYVHGDENPFPGGEFVAENNARNAVKNIMVHSAKNKQLKRGEGMSIKTARQLVILRKSLNDIGENKYADKISKLLLGLKVSLAQEGVKSDPADKHKRDLARARRSRNNFESTIRLEAGPKLANIHSLQSALIYAGFKVSKTGKPDGDWGKMSKAAYINLLKQLKADKPEGYKLWEMLLKSNPKKGLSSLPLYLKKKRQSKTPKPAPNNYKPSEPKPTTPKLREGHVDYRDATIKDTEIPANNVTLPESPGAIISKNSLNLEDLLRFRKKNGPFGRY